MRSITTRCFRDRYSELPETVRAQARKAYRLFRSNPAHPGLHFKKVDDELNIYSVRVGLSHRALGELAGSQMTWFWIGSHKAYDRKV